MKQRSRAAWLFLPLLLIAVAAGAQTIPVEVEVGYRWADISGNENLYRSQVNERQGFVLRSLTVFTTPRGSDHFRLDATDIGDTPAGSLRIDTGRDGAYRLRLGYRTFDSFNALPAFANPVLSQGITPGQHTWDRTRTMFDADLELLSFSKFTPFIGWSYGRNNGPGTMTYSLGSDEFRLGSDLEETEREIRLGTSFNVGKFTGQVTQGWRGLKSSESFSLTEGAGAGNNPGSILGQPISATTITRNSSLDVESPFTNAYVMADLFPRVKLIGEYTRFSSEALGNEVESANGSFVSFEISRFFLGLAETSSSRAKNDTWRGNARAEITITDSITLETGYRSEHRGLQGTGLITSLYSDTLTFGGFDPRSVQAILFSDNSLDRDEDVLSATVSARAVGPLTLRAGYSISNQDYRIAPDLAEIVVPGNQDGSFSRKVRTIDTSATFSKRLFSIGASFRTDEADQAVLRTDFTDRNRLRLRASFHTPGNFVRAGVTADRTNQSGDREATGFAAHGSQYIADVEVAPIAPLRLRASYSRFKADSIVTTRRPETFALDTSEYNEDGTSIEGGIGLLFAKTSLDASFSRFENEGSIPFTVDRIRLRAAYDVFTHAGVVVEWSKDNYEETAAFGQYDAKRFGLYLRLRP